MPAGQRLKPGWHDRLTSKLLVFCPDCTLNGVPVRAMKMMFVDQPWPKRGWDGEIRQSYNRAEHMPNVESTLP
jgi:hypothetical protein